MSQAVIVRGICASCKFGPECVNHHGAAVMDCAQFEGYAYAPARPRQVAFAVHEVTTVGLCPRCQAEGQCTLPRTESGVWLCAGFC